LGAAEVFVRKSSGLVRGVPIFDAWVYNCLTMGWLSVAAFNIFYNVAVFPGGDQTMAILLTALLGTSMWTTYMFIVTAMPRSGIDWIAQSRFLSPWVAFPIVIGDFFYLIYWDVWAYWFATFLALNPVLTVFGVAYNNATITALANWLVTPPGYFTVGLILMLLMGWQLTLPITFFAKIQRFLMLFASIALVVFIVAMLSTPANAFISNFNELAGKFGISSDYYHEVIKTAAQSGYNPNPGFNWYDQIGQLALIWSLLGWAFWSAQLSGEIKSADKLRAQNFMMNGSGWITAIAWLVVWLVVQNTAGSDFIKSSVTLYNAGQWKLPIPPYMSLYLTAYDPRLGAVVMAALGLFLLGMVCNAYQVYYNTMVGPVRMFFAMAFDRGLPDIFTRIHRRWRTPSYVVMLSWVAALIIIYISAYAPNVAPVFLPASLSSGVIPYFVTSLAGALMPFTGKAIYEVSPAAKYKVGKVPLITITGIISVIFNATMAYYWLTVPALGINPASMVFVIAAYVVGIIWYLFWRTYKKRQGIDFSLAFKEVPPD
jgi:amino acid transporter